MAMSALEMIDFYGEQAEESACAIIAATKKQNSDLAVLNVNQQFKCTLMQGLIQWRCNFQSPRPALLRAAENFVTGVEIIRSMRGSSGAILGLWFETAAIIGYLVDVTIDSPKLEQPLSNRNLDGLIVKWLHTGDVDSDYEKYLALLKHERLAYQTYLALKQAYSFCLKSQISPRSGPRAALSAARNFVIIVRHRH